MVRLRTEFLIVVTFLLAITLGCFRQPNPADKLLERLKSEQPRERLTAVTAIKDSPPIPARFIPALILALDDDDIHVRRTAANALSWCGADGKAFIPELTQVANNHPDPQVRDAVVHAINKIGEAQ